MAQFSKISQLGIVPLLLFLRVPSVSAVIINVVISEVDEVWQESGDESLRRKNPDEILESVLRLCRPPQDTPWIGVYAIDPRVTSCEAVNGGSSNWVIRESDWERPDFLPKPPGTVLQIEGPGPMVDERSWLMLPISNTEFKEDYLSFGPPLGPHHSEPSKWVVERFGNNNNYETLSPKNKLMVGDTLRFWDPEIPNGFQQLYMHRVKGSPQRLNRLRPFVENDGYTEEEYALMLANIPKEYPTAELRIASLGDDEIVGPGVPTRAQRLLRGIGKAKNNIGSLLSRVASRKQPFYGRSQNRNQGRPDADEQIPVAGDRPRVRSEELEVDPSDVYGDPSPLKSAEELFQELRMDLPQIPSRAEISLKKSIKKQNMPSQEVVEKFEESKEDFPKNQDEDVRRPIDMERSSRSSRSASSKLNESGRGRALTSVDPLSVSQSQTEYQTAIGGEGDDDDYDSDEEDRLGDIMERTGDLDLKSNSQTE
ncbi:hypothetical protein TWF281_006487 [Arthrobotrys megalospora]